MATVMTTKLWLYRVVAVGVLLAVMAILLGFVVSQILGILCNKATPLTLACECVCVHKSAFHCMKIVFWLNELVKENRTYSTVFFHVMNW